MFGKNHVGRGGVFPGAQVGASGLSVAGGGAFAGAYDDTPNIAAIYSMARRTLTSYEGNLVRLREDGGNTEQDFGYDADGNLDTTAIATFLGANNGHVVTLYDQSGNGNHATQSTAAAQPLYVASGQNSRPVMRFDGTDGVFLEAANFPHGNTVSVLVGRTLDTGHADFALAVGVGNDSVWQMRNRPTSPVGYGMEARSPNGFAVATKTLDTFEIVTGIADDTNVDIYINGAAGTGDTGGLPAASTAALRIGRGDLADEQHKGDIAELVIAGTAWSTAEREAAESAAADYWGITLS